MRAAFLLVLLPGCLSELLEAPYVVTTQLGAAHGVAPSGRDTLLVATDSGLWEVDAAGAHTRLLDGPVQSVSAHPDAIYALRGDSIGWGPLPARGAPFAPAHSQPARGVVDLAAWCGALVLLADPSGVTAWDRDTGETFAWATGLSQVRAVSLGGSCDEALVVTATSVLAASPKGTRTLAQGLTDARGAAQDSQGRLWVVAGARPVLSRVDNGTPVEFARYLGDPRDVQIGVGGRWPGQNLYLADGEGKLAYVRLP